MNKNSMVSLFILLVVCGGYFIGGERGKWKELTVSKVNLSHLKESSLSFEEQKKIYLKFEYEICKASVPCSESTHSGNSNEIFMTCSQSKSMLSKLHIDLRLPKEVQENMGLYLSSSLNSINQTIDAWEERNNGRGPKGITLLSRFKYWSIDTCSYDSIPQKMLRLYGIGPKSGKKIMTCDEVIQAYSD